MPLKNIHGNGAQTIKYTANGEASDWLLNSYNIYSMSPELGTVNKKSDEFFILNVADLKEVI